jgi:hypothetical protein
MQMMSMVFDDWRVDGRCSVGRERWAWIPWRHPWRRWAGCSLAWDAFLSSFHHLHLHLHHLHLHHLPCPCGPVTWTAPSPLTGAAVTSVHPRRNAATSSQVVALVECGPTPFTPRHTAPNNDDKFYWGAARHSFACRPMSRGRAWCLANAKRIRRRDPPGRDPHRFCTFS